MKPCDQVTRRSFQIPSHDDKKIPRSTSYVNSNILPTKEVIQRCSGETHDSTIHWFAGSPADGDGAPRLLIYTTKKLTWQWTKPTIWRCISLLITSCKYILSLHRLIRLGSLCLPQTQWKSGWRCFSTQQLIFKYLGMGSFKLFMSCFSTGTLRWFWSNYRDLTRVFTPNGGDLVKWDPIFPGKSRWRWNIISLGFNLKDIQFSVKLSRLRKSRLEITIGSIFSLAKFAKLPAMKGYPS